MPREVVTVFGGAGFIGRYVVRALASNGATVKVACRRSSDASFCRAIGDVGQVVIAPCNVRDEESVRSTVEGSDKVVNLAGILYERGSQTFEQVHHQSAARIARAAADAGVEALVHVSAIGADHPGLSSYSKSKGAGEAAVRALFARAVIIRPSIVFGPEDDFFNRFAGYARVCPALPLIGGGNTKFQPVYVCDVADAISWALSRDKAAGRVFELGGPRLATFRELMELLLSFVSRERLLMPIPFGFGMVMAALGETLLSLPSYLAPGLTPAPILTRDQVRLLRQDNIVTGKFGTFSDMGIAPVSMETILPSYLSRFRPASRI